MNTRLAALFALVLAALTPAAGPAQDGATLSGDALVQALRRGGFNLYFRHAQTDWSQHDHVAQARDWESCDPARIRQLSAQGRATARAVGEAMRGLAIPVGRVLASPYCRTVQTAELMGYGPAVATTDVVNMRVAEYFGGRDAIVARARALLATPPPPGTNTLIAAHGNVAQAATPVYPAEAEGLVLRPDATSGFTVVARITPRDWARLLEASGTSR